ncbi:hypothetical protein [Moraxella lacunata]
MGQALLTTCNISEDNHSSKPNVVKNRLLLKCNAKQEKCAYYTRKIR